MIPRRRPDSWPARSTAFGQTVDPAAVTVTANNVNKAYGDPLPSFTLRYTGLQNGDSAADFATQPTAVTTATAASHVNLDGYAITPSGAVDPDYRFSYLSGTLTVTPVSLTVTADNVSKEYGCADPTLTASFSGFVNGDSAASLTANWSSAPTATQSSPIIAGGYLITPSGAIDPDYSFRYTSGTLTITQAPLTVTANDLSMTYGSTVPELTDRITGFVNGDTASVVSGTPSLETTATQSSSVGAYAITVDVSSLSATNYTFSGQSGSLAIDPAALDVTANDQSMTYGGTVPSLTFVISGLVNGDTQSSVLSGGLTTTGTSSSDIGGYAITQRNLASNSNYALTFTPGTFTINPAELDVAANNRSMTYGGTMPALTFGVSGLVNGDTQGSVLSGALTTTASTTSNAGKYGIAQGSLAADANYTVSFTPGTLTITPAPLRITANNASTVFGGTPAGLDGRFQRIRQRRHGRQTDDPANLEHLGNID